MGKYNYTRYFILYQKCIKGIIKEDIKDKEECTKDKEECTKVDKVIIKVEIKELHLIFSILMRIMLY